MQNAVPWPLVPDALAQMDTDPGASLIWLGRYGRRSALVSESERITRHPYWGPLLALQLAWALRLCGDPIAADRWILVAHRLDPALGLIPDPWGLWSDKAASGDSPLPAEDQQRARDLIKLLRDLRWQQPCFPLTPLPDWRGDWQDRQLDSFGLLLAGTPSEQQQSLQQALVVAVGEREIAADAAAALRWWSFVAEAWPEWGYPRLKAADMALATGDLRSCGHWLADPSADLEASPWFFDLAARLALASGDLAAAMEHWGLAMAKSADGDSSGRELVEMFRQRRRDARRNEGPNRVRALRRSGDTAAAVQLQVLLVQQDPQWEPFRALERELSPDVAAEASPAPAPGQVGAPWSAVSPRPGGAAQADCSIERFATFLESSAAQAGLRLSPDGEGLSPEAFASALARAEGAAALID
jgi:hypothetical protein